MSEPAWLVEARAHEGLREIPGPRHNATILGWAKRLGARVLGITVSTDETAWCGTFAAHCVSVAGLKPPKIAVRAKSWAAFGEPIKYPALGCIAVFERPGGGHVGFVVGQDRTAYHILGGNQSNGVNVTRIAKARCIALRWPAGAPLTAEAPTASLHSKLSENEA